MFYIFYIYIYINEGPCKQTCAFAAKYKCYAMYKASLYINILISWYVDALIDYSDGCRLQNTADSWMVICCKS